jgi:hypothetical protein
VEVEVLVKDLVQTKVGVVGLVNFQGQEHLDLATVQAPQLKLTTSSLK